MAGERKDDETETGHSEEQEQVVTPFEVRATKAGGKIDYNRLVNKFGCQRLDNSLISRVEQITHLAPHVFLRRGIFFAHRDFNQILDAYEKGEKFYLYTGRGPSSDSLHLGHLIPFMFTKYLQDVFKVPVVIQLTDDEKFMLKGLSIEEGERFVRDNCKDIIALGFDITKTFIFSDFGFMGGAFYRNVCKVARCVPFNQVKGIFGFTTEDHIGKIGFPSIQAAPSFASSFPHLFSAEEKNLRCLIPCAIDQDPYFRMTRDVAPRLGYSKPALLESSFFPALQGESGKMSASDPLSAIYVNDSDEEIEKKVIKYAFSGGRTSRAEHMEFGADIETDVSIKYLEFFLDDDVELECIKREYAAGRMSMKEVKERLIQVLTELVANHREARAKVTDEVIDAFMEVRRLPSSLIKRII